jgi:hypothetical protein
MICTSHQCYLDDQIKKNGLGGHVARIRDLLGHTGLWSGGRREINHLEDLGVDGRKILK